jgi:hypothetical protein
VRKQSSNLSGNKGRCKSGVNAIFPSPCFDVAGGEFHAKPIPCPASTAATRLMAPSAMVTRRFAPGSFKHAGEAVMVVGVVLLDIGYERLA